MINTDVSQRKIVFHVIFQDGICIIFFNSINVAEPFFEQIHQ